MKKPNTIVTVETTEVQEAIQKYLSSKRILQENAEQLLYIQRQMQTNTRLLFILATDSWEDKIRLIESFASLTIG